MVHCRFIHLQIWAKINKVLLHTPTQQTIHKTLLRKDRRKVGVNFPFLYTITEQKLFLFCHKIFLLKDKITSDLPDSMAKKVRGW